VHLQDFRLERRRYDDAQVQRLVDAVQAEYVTRYGGPDEAVVEPGEFDPPGGMFFVGILDGEPVATGGWRRIAVNGASEIVEIKRMFVLDKARRRGLARRILAELEASATAAGAQQIVLNTGIHQPEAIALYESAGYEPITGFGHYACHPNALFYAKPVDSLTTG
jgi:GNAT superfamily N-acetyltransferase